MDAITGGLGRQGKVYATGLASCQQLIGGTKSGFRFTHSHGGFDDIHTRAGNGRHSFALHIVGGESEKLFKCQARYYGGGNKTDNANGLFGASLRIAVITVGRRKEPFVGANPVRHRCQSGKPPDDRIMTDEIYRYFVNAKIIPHFAGTLETF